MQITTLAGLISTQKKKQKTSKQKRQTNKNTNAVLNMAFFNESVVTTYETNGCQFIPVGRHDAVITFSFSRPRTGI